MIQDPELSKLTVFIEENLRAVGKSAMPFVDPRHIAGRVGAKQNHIIFGRRGTGKTRLLSALTYESTKKDPVAIYINLEDLKDASFEAALPRVLSVFFEKLAERIGENRGWLSFKTGRFQKKLQKLSSKLRALTAEEVESLGDQLSGYKALINEASKKLGDRAIFLALDDYYFVPTAYQPELLDYFHRLAKDSELFIKVATVRERSVLYRGGAGEYVGMELGHDAHEVDLNFTLDQFEEVKEFMHELLEVACEGAGTDYRAEDFFSGNGFAQLCLVSEGIPRNFLTSFVKLASTQATFTQGFINTEAVVGMFESETNLSDAKSDKKENPLKKIMRYLEIIIAKLTGRKTPESHPAKSSSQADVLQTDQPSPEKDYVQV